MEQGRQYSACTVINAGASVAEMERLSSLIVTNFNLKSAACQTSHILLAGVIPWINKASLALYIASAMCYATWPIWNSEAVLCCRVHLLWLKQKVALRFLINVYMHQILYIPTNFQVSERLYGGPEYYSSFYLIDQSTPYNNCRKVNCYWRCNKLAKESELRGSPYFIDSPRSLLR